VLTTPRSRFFEDEPRRSAELIDDPQREPSIQEKKRGCYPAKGRTGYLLGDGRKKRSKKTARAISGKSWPREVGGET